MRLRFLAIAAGIASLAAAGASVDGFADVVPTVTGVTPAGGTYAGGDQIIIAGTGFVGATDLLYAPPATGSSGDVTTQCPSPSYSGPTPCFIVDSSSQITAVTPPHPDATVDIEVETGAGTSSAGPADQFSFTGQPVPAAVQVAPHAGPAAGGSQVTITPDGGGPGYFTFATQVNVGSTAITATPCPGTSPSDCFTVDGDSQITAYMPASPGPGSNDSPVDVTVTTAAGTSPTDPDDSWTWASPPSLAPSSSSGVDSGGTAIALTGTGFESSPPGGYTVAAVTFTNTGNSADVATVTQPCGASTADCFSVASPTAMTVYAPATDDATFYLQVTTPGGTTAQTAADEYTANPEPPVVASVSPATGNAAGGETVVISSDGGSGPQGGSYASASQVQFGTAATGIVATSPCPATVTAPCFTVDDADHITVQDIPSAAEAVAPSSPAPEQAVDVTVTTSGGTSATSGADQFTYYATAQVSAVSPAAQPQGSTAGTTVSGSNFLSVSEVDLVPTSSATGATVRITSSPCPSSGSACFTVSSASSLQLVPPLTTPTGGYTVEVVTPAGPSVVASGGSATYVVQVPSGAVTVSTVSPDVGPQAGGQDITVTGTGFTGSSWAVSSVSLGTTAVTAMPCPAPPSSPCFTLDSSTQLTVHTPSSSTADSVVDVTVQVTALDSSSSATSAASVRDHYEYAGLPTVTRVSPSSGTTAGMTRLTLTGAHFSGTLYGTSAVWFGTAEVTSTPCPTLPSAPCFSVVSATSIVAYAPAHAAGVVDITVTTPGGTSSATSADHYQYTAPQPSVSSVVPSDGPLGGGTAVTVSGSGFTAATGVSFGGTAASSFSVVNDTTIDATSPPHAAGVVDVTVTTAGGTSSTNPGDQFTYRAIPSVSGVSPSSGPMAGGNAISLSGSGFSAATSVTVGGVSITSNPCPSSPAAPCFTVNSDTAISVEDLPGVSTPQSVDITVTNAGGTSATSASDHYAYLQPAPAVSGLSPSAGGTAGLTSVVVSGTNFGSSSAGYSVSSVAFGTVIVTVQPCPASPTAACFTQNSSSQITAYTPPQSAGQVNVVVTTTASQDGVAVSGTPTGAGLFTYAPRPAVTGLSPAAGAGGGGTFVSLQGADFSGAGYNATGVTVGGVAVTSTPCPATPTSACFTVNSATSLTLYTPPHATGPVDITVTTPGGASATGSADHFLYVAPGVFSGTQQYRILDTRHGTCINCGSGALQSGESRTVNLAVNGPSGQHVPANALAVMLNVTAVNATQSTFLSVYPTGSPLPNASNLNPANANPLAVLVTTSVGSGESVQVYNHTGSVDVIIDVEGWFTAPATTHPAGQFHPTAPTRVCDTRSGSGTPCSGNPIGGNSSAKVTLTDLTSSAVAAVFNLTATGGTASTFLTVSAPSASDQCAGPGFGSNVNALAGKTVPNRVAALLGPNHDICVYNHAGTVNIVVDVNGWFGASGDTGGTMFYAVAPLRICDTRVKGTACPSAPLGPGATITVPMTALGHPLAVVLSATAVNPSATTYLALFPSDTSRPNGSDLNPSKGVTASNLVFVEASSTGATPYSVSVYNLTGSVNLVLDAAGWFQ